MQEKIPKETAPGSPREIGPTPQESKEGKIVVESIWEAYLKIDEDAKKTLRERFGPKGEDPMDYHVPEHSENLAKNAKKILEVIKETDPALVNAFDLDFVVREGLYHDIVQENIKESGKPRKRVRGFEGFEDENLGKIAREKGYKIGNERASAEALLENLEKYVYPDDRRVFAVDDPKFRQEVLMDFAATYPDFAFAELPDGTRGLKVSQRYLTPDSSLRAFAIAHADLRGDCGINSDYEWFRRSGNAELKETQDQIKEKLSKGVENLTKEEIAEIALSVLKSKKDQRGFALHQKILWNESLNNNKIINASLNAEEIKKRLKNLIRDKNFDANAEAAKEEYEALEKKYGSIEGGDQRKERPAQMTKDDLIELLETVGYKIKKESR